MEIIFDSIGKVLVIGIVCFAICYLVKQIAKARKGRKSKNRRKRKG